MLSALALGTIFLTVAQTSLLLEPLSCLHLGTFRNKVEMISITSVAGGYSYPVTWRNALPSIVKIVLAVSEIESNPSGSSMMMSY